MPLHNFESLEKSNVVKAIISRVILKSKNDFASYFATNYTIEPKLNETGGAGFLRTHKRNNDQRHQEMNRKTYISEGFLGRTSIDLNCKEAWGS